MNQIKNEEQLVGQVFKRMCEIKKYKILIFKDSFVAYYDGWDHCEDKKIMVETGDISRMYPEECYQCKLISKKEMNEIIKKKNTELKRMRYLKYQELKEEFEGK